MTSASYTLHHGDCLEVLRTLPDASVDAVITDPPYAQTNEAYDSAIACQPEVWREAYRVAVPGAVLISFAGSPTYHRIAGAIEAGGWRVRQMWGWVYRDGLITSAWPKEGFDRLRPAFDPICFATKGKALLNVQRNGDGWKRSAVRNKSFSERARPSTRLEATGVYPTAMVSDGIAPFEYFLLSRTGKRSTTDHPNEKPLDLMLWLLDKLSTVGTVLDPFAGSGTTGVAALAEGRSFIGIEKDAGYFAIAEQRLADAAMQQRMAV